jgi:hypothetical protein
MEIAISGVYADMYPIIAPLELRAMDCNISDEGAGECFHGGAYGDPHGYGPYRE